MNEINRVQKFSAFFIATLTVCEVNANPPRFCEKTFCLCGSGAATINFPLIPENNKFYSFVCSLWYTILRHINLFSHKHKFYYEKKLPKNHLSKSYSMTNFKICCIATSDGTLNVLIGPFFILMYCSIILSLTDINWYDLKLF